MLTRLSTQRALPACHGVTLKGYLCCLYAPTQSANGGRKVEDRTVGTTSPSLIRRKQEVSR